MTQVFFECVLSAVFYVEFFFYIDYLYWCAKFWCMGIY